MLVALLLLSAQCAAPELPPGFSTQLGDELRERDFSGMLSAHGPDGELFRYASDEVDERSVFWVGSVSKQITAVLALHAVDRGELALDRPVVDYLPELPANALRREGVACTLDHLLHHTCGLPKGNVCSVRFDGLGDRAALLECVGRLVVETEPGRVFRYSNVGYDLVGVLVERVGGAMLPELLRARLTEPLGLRDTGIQLAAAEPHYARLAPGQVFAGLGHIGSWPWVMAAPTAPGRFGGSGNVYSTVADLHRWNGALHSGRILEPSTYARMVAPGLDRYGYGLSIEGSEEGGRWLWHNGSLTPMGWSAFVAWLPDAGISVVGLANRSIHTSYVQPAARALVRASLGEAPEGQLLVEPKAQDFAIEMIFPIMTLILLAAFGWFVWLAVRGPRRHPVDWLTQIDVAAALGFFGVSLAGLPGAALLCNGILLSLLLAMAVHRQRWADGVWGWWRDKEVRNKLLVLATVLLLLLLTWTPEARVWLLVTLSLQLLLALRFGYVASRRADPRASA